MKNMQLMAEEVVPAFRGPDGRPDHLRTDRLGPVTVTEHAARIGRPALRPVVRVTGVDGAVRDLDAATGHVPEVAAAAQGLDSPRVEAGGTGDGGAHAVVPAPVVAGRA